MSTTTTSYAEACEHAEMNYRNTGGLVCGGTYRIHSDEVGEYEVDLRVDPVLEIARPVREEDDLCAQCDSPTDGSSALCDVCTSDRDPWTGEVFTS